MAQNINTLLTTVAEEDLKPIASRAKEINLELLHLPLEYYHYLGNRADENPDTKVALDKKQQMVYGHPRNARFSLQWYKAEGITGEVKEQWLHFAIDKTTADLLEAEGIPAIHPNRQGKAIDLLELMMRLGKMENMLYPTGEDVVEEMPALFEEMDLDYQLLTLYRKQGPDSDQLETLRRKLNSTAPDVLLCHSRQSVIRTRAAFPDLDWEHPIVGAANKGTAQKLEQEGVEPDIIGDGTYDALFEELAAHLNTSG